MNFPKLGTCPLLLALAAGACGPAAAEVPKVVKEVCGACHGVDGNGAQPPIPEYPRLSGIDAKHLRKQLKDYQQGKRRNPVMAPMAQNLTPEQIDAVADYYAAQPRKPNTVSNPGLIDLGKKLYEDGDPATGVPSCSGCHLERGKGDARFPHLAAQNAAYVYGELKKFKSGERDNDRGLVMQSVALRMSDTEMKAVAEYITGLR